VDAFLEHQAERRLHAERANASVLARKRDLEDFIARNKARASTASRAKSKSRELERLELEEVAADEPTAAIQCPAIQPRKGPAARCNNLVIGYGDAAVARGIDVEVVHGSRAAIVGDNGQGKTTFLRTLVDSLSPLSGHVKWGYGCELGIYAQHVYTSLPPEQTVLGYLERAAAVGTKSQRILDVAGAMLFRGKAVEKRVEVLSGGERARLCMAGLLLGSSNVLILDEPGNHLDVETVDALAQALVNYAGTVIFTSHDRSFVRAVATSVIEVKDGRVVHYSGSYEHYLAAMNREIDDEEVASGRATPAKKPARPGAAAKEKTTPGRSDRDLRREIGNLERSIARLDGDKKRVNAALLATTDVEAAVKLHAELTEVTSKLTAAEESWLALQEQLAATEPA
jgi:ATP-binding cassette subfamily F protein 3